MVPRKIDNRNNLPESRANLDRKTVVSTGSNSGFSEPAKFLTQDHASLLFWIASDTLRRRFF